MSVLLRAEPLSAVDTAWLHMEDPTNLMMVTGVLVFEQPLSYARVVETLATRLLKFDRFRQRVVEHSPFGTPHWEPDPHFDIHSHIHRVALPAPGDASALRDMVSDLMSVPLDFSKPLWQYHLIERYGRGCAIVTRLHHCIGDGMALMHVIMSLTDAVAEPGKAPVRTQPEGPRKTDAGVSALTAILQQGFDALLHPGRVLELLQKGSDGASALENLVFMPPDSRTVFKGALGVSKRCAWSLPFALDDIKRVGHATGGTVNDVLLTVLTGALRRYLEGRGELADGVEVRAVVPVNLRPPETVPTLGNRFGLVFIALPVGLEDPIERLLELKDRMDALKESPEAILTFGLLNAVGHAPANVESRVIDLFAANATAVVTNVPGPKEPIYFAGGKVSEFMFWVPQSGRLGLGVSILSYAGMVRVGIATDQGLAPDPEKILEAFAQEFAALAERARVLTTGLEAAPAKARPKRPPVPKRTRKAGAPLTASSLKKRKGPP